MQWFGVLQKDGPGAENATEIHSVADFIEMRNRKRAKLGLPLIRMPEEPKKEDPMALDSELKPGVRVASPHGVGEIIDEDKPNRGWRVKLSTGQVLFYHAWDLTLPPPLPPKE